ncbi:MAG TPA: YvcK family protein [Terriglobales bacterium]|nr:YvcK family protein [Terriglobales bacterium]
MKSSSSNSVAGYPAAAGSLRPLQVVAMGGGTGLSTLLKGLKHYVAAGESAAVGNRRTIAELCAVVTVTDDGGSSGRLRKEFNVLPPGDIRNCIAALSEDEALLSRLFQHRFHAGAGLNGHSFGNLFLTALTAITGDFAEAVKQSSAILATRGHIYPSTTSDVQLEAVMADGSRVRGETNITASTERIVSIHLRPADAQPLPQTLEAIAKADLITIGPGSLFTSLVPNLLVRGIPEAVAASRAVKVFVCNLMTEANESLGLTAADHIRVLHEHAGVRIVDYALVNRTPVPSELKAKYAAEGGSQIEVAVAAIEKQGAKVILGDYLETAAGVARHATDRVTRDLLALVSQVAAAST